MVTDLTSLPESHVPEPSWRGRFLSAMRFWEPRRILYNAVLLVFALLWLFGTWPHFRPALNPLHLAQFAVLGLIANILYSTAYLFDLTMQWTKLIHHGTTLRWTLWIAGMLVAIVLENYWIADEIYPFVS